VQVEHLPYADVLARYDRPTTVFYLDPPYIGLDLYRYNLPNDQYAVLASQLSQIRGKFLLSINDCPLSRRLFSGFHMRPVRVAYTVHRSVPTVRELLFSNTPFIDPAYPEDRIPPSR
jgi:DNA adenine methylase